MGGRAAQLCGRGQKFRAASARTLFHLVGPGMIGRSAPPLKSVNQLFLSHTFYKSNSAKNENRYLL